MIGSIPKLKGWLTYLEYRPISNSLNFSISPRSTTLELSLQQPPTDFGHNVCTQSNNAIGIASQLRFPLRLLPIKPPTMPSHPSNLLLLPVTTGFIKTKDANKHSIHALLTRTTTSASSKFRHSRYIDRRLYPASQRNPTTKTHKAV